ncbi:MAG: flagellar biosynthetic protein FliR [Pseudomonadota bacterium]|mgnify:CR=1 FL=1
MEAVQNILDTAPLLIYAAVAVFARIGAAAAFFPGIGDMLIPARVRLFAALLLTSLIFPAVVGTPDPRLSDPPFLLIVIGSEAIIGVFIGLSVRLILFALQIAGSIIAMNLSMTQLFGAGVGPDPDASISTLLTLAAITMALSLGLHVKFVAALIATYDFAPLGASLSADIALSGIMGGVAEAFTLALALSAPILVAAFVYNLLLGAVNRAMPQLMVALVGMPALSLGGMILILLSGPVLLQVWMGRFDDAILTVGGFQ